MIDGGCWGLLALLLALLAPSMIDGQETWTTDVTAATVLQDRVADPDGIDYVLGRRVRVSAPLTLRPGVRIQVVPGAGLDVVEAGSLNALGTARRPIVFVGQEPSAGSWSGIDIDSGSSANELRYVEVIHGGGGGPAAVSVGSGGTVVITRSTLRSTVGCGIGVEHGGTVTTSVNTYADNAGGDVCVGDLANDPAGTGEPSTPVRDSTGGTTAAGGIVFEDLDSDGEHDADEPGVDGIRIALLDPESGAPLYAPDGTTRTVRTDADGRWRFEADGSFELRFRPIDTGDISWLNPEGYLETVPTEHHLRVGNGEEISDADFAYEPRQTSAAGGIVFEDLDSDGERDADEPGVEDVQIALLDPDSGEPLENPADGTQRTVRTDADGRWRFEADGSFELRFRPMNRDVRYWLNPEGYLETVPTEHHLRVENGEEISDADFAYEPQQTSAAGGIVFEDLDSDGEHDADEPGVDGIEVVLLDPESGEPLYAPDGTARTVRTDADGRWRFEEVGSFELRFRPRDPGARTRLNRMGYLETTPTEQHLQVGNGEEISDADFAYEPGATTGTETASQDDSSHVEVEAELLAHLPFDASPLEERTGLEAELIRFGSGDIQTMEGHLGNGSLFVGGRLVLLPLDIDFDAHRQLTVSAWVYIDERRYSEASVNEDGGTLFDSGVGSDGTPGLHLAGERLRASAGRNRATLYRDLPRGEWTHVAAVWDYDARTVRIHVGDADTLAANLDMDPADLAANGRSQSALDHPTDEDRDPRRYVLVGAQTFDGNRPLSYVGLDDFRIYAGALSPEEIAGIRESEGPATSEGGATTDRSR